MSRQPKHLLCLRGWGTDHPSLRQWGGSPRQHLTKDSKGKPATSRSLSQHSKFPPGSPHLALLIRFCQFLVGSSNVSLKLFSASEWERRKQVLLRWLTRRGQAKNPRPTRGKLVGLLPSLTNTGSMASPRGARGGDREGGAERT